MHIDFCNSYLSASTSFLLSIIVTRTFPLPVFSQPVGVAHYRDNIYCDAVTYIVSREVANIFKYFQILKLNLSVIVAVSFI